MIPLARFHRLSLVRALTPADWMPQFVKMRNALPRAGPHEYRWGMEKNAPLVEPLLFTEPEAAAMLKLCERTLRKERQAGRLAFVMVGRAIRYTPADLEAFIEGARALAPTDANRRRPDPDRRRPGVIDFEALRAERRRRNGRS